MICCQQATITSYAREGEFKLKADEFSANRWRDGVLSIDIHRIHWNLYIRLLLMKNFFFNLRAHARVRLHGAHVHVQLDKMLARLFLQLLRLSPQQGMLLQPGRGHRLLRDRRLGPILEAPLMEQ